MMKLLILLFVGATVFAGSATTEEKALEKLRALAKEIRERSYEADATIARAKEESKDILARAEAEAAKIKAEADEYVRKVEKEIEQIKKKMAGGKEDFPGAPTSAELSQSLQSVIEPIRSCWAEKKEKRDACAWKKVQAALAPYLKRK